MTQEIYSVFINYKGDVLCAMVHSRNLNKFLEMGYKKTHAEAEVSVIENSCGDQKSGENWELIKDLPNKDEVEQFVKDMTGVDIDKRGSLDTVKEKALAVLNESKRANT